MISSSGSRLDTTAIGRKIATHHCLGVQTTESKLKVCIWNSGALLIFRVFPNLYRRECSGSVS